MMNRRAIPTIVAKDRHAEFVRVGERHVTNALKAIKRLKNLAQPRYDGTQEEVLQIRDALIDAIDDFMTAFSPKDLQFNFDKIERE